MTLRYDVWKLDLKAKTFLQLQLTTSWRNYISSVNLESRPELKTVSFTLSHEQNQPDFDCHPESFAQTGNSGWDSKHTN